MEDDFLRDLRRPDVAAPHHQQQLRATLLNAQKSAVLGFWLVTAPCFFLFCVGMKYAFSVNLHLVDVFIELMASLSRSTLGWLVGPVFMLILPLLGLATNLLSVMHISREQGFIHIRIKPRLWNWLLIVVCLLIVLVITGYFIAENVVHITIMPNSSAR